MHLLLRIWLISSFCFQAGCGWAQPEKKLSNAAAYFVSRNFKDFSWLNTGLSVIRTQGHSYLDQAFKESLPETYILKNQLITSLRNQPIKNIAFNSGQKTYFIHPKAAFNQPIRFVFTINSPAWKVWWFFIMVILLFLGTVFVINWYFLQQKLKLKIKQLETDHKIQLERERIARDLHDNVGSHLTYIVNRLEDSPNMWQGSEQQHQIEQLREYTRQTITQLRETIWAIRKEHIRVGELNEKLQKLLWQLIPPQGNLRYQFKSQTNEAILLTPVQTLNIFRIAQEAITNVIKYSQANFFTVQLITVADKHLQLLIQDNGIGFEPAQVDVNENYGLTNMHQRAAELNTNLKIESDKGHGTQITLLVDLTESLEPVPETKSTNNPVYKKSSAKTNL